jgi:hypothetical protein
VPDPISNVLRPSPQLISSVALRHVGIPDALHVTGHTSSLCVMVGKF